jgi:hypothetical protein
MPGLEATLVLLHPSTWCRNGDAAALFGRHLADPNPSILARQHMRRSVGETAMQDDIQALTELNRKVGDAENRGDREWLTTILAPKLAFQRADDARTVDDRVAFLQKVVSGGARTTCIVEPIEMYGDRAIVRCIVTVGDQEFDNLRVNTTPKADRPTHGWRCRFK